MGSACRHVVAKMNQIHCYVQCSNVCLTQSEACPEVCGVHLQPSAGMAATGLAAAHCKLRTLGCTPLPEVLHLCNLEGTPV